METEMKRARGMVRQRGALLAKCYHGAPPPSVSDKENARISDFLVLFSISGNPASGACCWGRAEMGGVYYG